MDARVEEGRGEVIHVRLMEISRNVRCGFLRWRNERGHGALNIAVGLGRAHADAGAAKLPRRRIWDLPCSPRRPSRRGAALQSLARARKLSRHTGWYCELPPWFPRGTVENAFPTELAGLSSLK